MKTNNDKVILNLQKEIGIKKDLLKKSKVKFSPITNGSITINGINKNILTFNKQELLLTIAQLSAQKEGLKKILPSEEIIINSYSIDDWITDLTNKYNYLNVAEEEKRLKELEDKLHNLLSNDKKVEIEIDSIRKLI